MSADTGSNMYKNAKTWNPFKGCSFDCSYCEPSFKRQAKRQMHRCQDCYDYRPHEHPERLGKIPSSEIVFVCGNADICFCRPEFTRDIIKAVITHSPNKYVKTFYFQSKQPVYFEQFLDEFTDNIILLTTLETNRDDGYPEVSKAPLPSDRYAQFLALDYPRKVVTIEPVMDFDPDIFTEWILEINPEYVWFGFNSKPESVRIPEPSDGKVKYFLRKLHENGIEIRGKELRGLGIPKP